MIALASSAVAVPLDQDLPILADALPEAEVVVWDDDAVEWAQFDAVIIRSTWDYPSRRDEFLAWTRSVAAVTRLWNPPELVAWNTDKRYLRDLAARGLPIVPSWFVEPGEPVPTEVDLAADLVVKPTVGGGSQGVVRATDDAAAVMAHVRALHAAGHCALVQPYRAAIEEVGETGIVHLGGAFSHGFAKAAILDRPITWEGDLFATETISRRTPTGAQRRLADAAVAAVGPTAYARVDLVPGPDGDEILELELTEPSLFLDAAPTAAERAAAAFRSLAS